MEKVDTLVVDKTGTLTEGKPSVVAIEVADGFEEQDLLRIAASLERSSEHPLAAAIVKAAEDRGLTLVEPSGVDQPVGKGIVRSEEHTSELQSLMRISYAVFCLQKTDDSPQSTNGSRRAR